MDIHVSEVSNVIPRTGTAEGKADEEKIKDRTETLKTKEVKKDEKGTAEEKADEEKIKGRTETLKTKEVKKDEKDWLPRVQDKILKLLNQYNEIKKKLKNHSISSNDLMSLDLLMTSLKDKEDFLNKRR